MIVVLILVSIGFVVTLSLLMFGPHRKTAGSGQGNAAQIEGDIKARREAAAALEKRSRELEDQRKELQELRAELKQTKKKLHDQREGEKTGQDLVRARQEVERSASIQLESVREELSHALAELSKLKSDQASGKGRRGAPASAPVPTPAPTQTDVTLPTATPLSLSLSGEPSSVTSPPMEKTERRFRELSDSDREKMERLEQRALKERTRAVEFEKELRRLKGRNETQHRLYTVAKGELDLGKDKFKALEKRLNRTLLERDMLRRAIKALEKVTGTSAERTELTAEEIAGADQQVEDRVKAEAAEAERRTEKARAEAEASAVSSVETAPPTQHTGDLEPTTIVRPEQPS